jgi:predicted nucleic acid-binding protein
VKFYLDASFVVSLFISDTHTEKADRWIAGQQDEAIVSELCALEFAAAVSRGVRTRRLAHKSAEERP